jgi:hypothetical protein
MLGKPFCPQEDSIAKAVRTGYWNESLEAHAAACSRCREAMLAAQAIQSLAVVPESHDTMPSASRLWCLALLEQRQRQATRARRSLAAVNLGISAMLVLASAGWLVWHWPELQSQLAAWRLNFWPQLWRVTWFVVEQVLPLASFPSTLALILLVGAGAFLLARPLFAED